MRPEDIKKEIDRLDLSEKLLLLEDVWDSIATANAELPVPEWKKAELDRRFEEFKSGKLALHDWSAVHEELRQKAK